MFAAHNGPYKPWNPTGLKKIRPIGLRDELSPNGIFEFNITKIEEFIRRNSDSIPLVEAAVSDFWNDFSSVNESHVEKVDIQKPVILAEISPGRFNLIDGIHRMEKARRIGIKSIQAYKIEPIKIYTKYHLRKLKR